MAQIKGLTDIEAAQRLSMYGSNDITEPTVVERVVHKLSHLISNPLILLLLCLGGIAYLAGDVETSSIIWIMMLMAVGLQLYQEIRAEESLSSIKSALRTTILVLRGVKGVEKIELESFKLVPGDILDVSVGDVVPCDCICMLAKQLRINQAPITGESDSVEKYPLPNNEVEHFLDDPSIPNIILTGSVVMAGSGLLKVCKTGDESHVGKALVELKTRQKDTDKNIHGFTMIMVRFIIIMAPLVLFIQIIQHGIALQPFLYAVSVSVGLAPEMLPMIICACLVTAANSLKDVCIIRRLNSLHALATTDLLCTDKTGTLTLGEIAVNSALNCSGNSSLDVQFLAFLNAKFACNRDNAIDIALKRCWKDEFPSIFEKLHEEVFNFDSRYSSVALKIVEMSSSFESVPGIRLLNKLNPTKHLVVCKGACNRVVDLCTDVFLEGRIIALQDEKGCLLSPVRNTISNAEREGLRILAIAIRCIESELECKSYSCLQRNLCLVGFITFADPPKTSALSAIQSLQNLGVSIKMLTGDAENVALSVAAKVGIDRAEKALVGSDIDTLLETLEDSEILHKTVKSFNVFACLTPRHKRIIVDAFKQDYRVGFLGDGVNDCAALHAADVGISVEGASAAAKNTADIILTKKSLQFLEKTVLHGRMSFVNMMKYIRMGASSNWGNMFSVVGASLSLSFMPMLPLQVVLSNLLYDFAQLGVPTDNVQISQIQYPQKWNGLALQKFIVYLGFVSSLFDFLTFYILLKYIGGNQDARLFHTGWFVEGLLSQTLIVFVLRRPPRVSRGVQNWRNYFGLDNSPSNALILASSLVCSLGIGLTQFETSRKYLGFVRLPTAFWFYLVGILVAYIVFTGITLPLMEVQRPDQSSISKIV